MKNSCNGIPKLSRIVEITKVITQDNIIEYTISLRTSLNIFSFSLSPSTKRSINEYIYMPANNSNSSGGAFGISGIPFVQKIGFIKNKASTNGKARCFHFIINDNFKKI